MVMVLMVEWDLIAVVVYMEITCVEDGTMVFMAVVAACMVAECMVVVMVAWVWVWVWVWVWAWWPRWVV